MTTPVEGSARSPWFDAQLFETHRRQAGVTWGRPLRPLTLTPSTQDLALEAVGGEAKTGIVWLAREQSAGRGRRGNRWQAPAGHCLMFSTLVRHRGSAEQLKGLSLAVGLALRDAVVSLDGLAPSAQHERRRKLRIKWPNDLYFDDRKLAGILVEVRAGPGPRERDWGLAIGVGLNTDPWDFGGHALAAVALAQLGVGRSARKAEALLPHILGHLEQRVAKCLTRGCASLCDEINAVDYLHGRRLRVGGIEGVGIGVDQRGRLLVRDRAGNICRMQSGHVQLLSEAT